MNRILLPFQNLIERASQLWASLTERERRLVSILSVAMLVTVVALGVTSFRKSLAHSHEVVENKRIALERVASLSAGFREAEAARNRIESRLRGSPVRLFSYLEEIATRQNLAIGDMQDRGTDNQDGLVRSSVELSFARISLRPLVEFLNEIERNPRLVKIEKLRIRHRNDDPELLDVNLTVSTYHLSES